MTTLSQQFPVALETGRTRAFASALEWPGWTRSGRDEATALDTLLSYAPRYQRAMRLAQLSFDAPTDLAALSVTERLTGDSKTDFGAPGVAPAVDSTPVDAAELERFQQILHASWSVFEEAIEAASDKPLHKGPRGGGRTALQILDHVSESHYSYLRMIYWRKPREKARDAHDTASMLAAIKQAEEQALAFATSDEMPETGPRGGALWKPRYFVRRAAWHILDHAWEIEDRLEP